MTVDSQPSSWQKWLLPGAGLLFLLSGATSLMYEVAWAKLLTLEFGSAAWSIATVVASFMAGLGSGGAWAGRRADRIRRPLRVYGFLELGIALFGMVSGPLLENIARVLDPLYGLVDGYFAFYLLAQFLLSFVMLVVPTFLMGASLPVLIVAVSREETFRRNVAVFYGINTLGAAIGTLVAGVFLLSALGIAHTIWVAVALGLLVRPAHFCSIAARDRASPLRSMRVGIVKRRFPGCCWPRWRWPDVWGSSIRSPGRACSSP
jgi:spermidine synthase